MSVAVWGGKGDSHVWGVCMCSVFLYWREGRRYYTYVMRRQLHGSHMSKAEVGNVHATRTTTRSGSRCPHSEHGAVSASMPMMLYLLMPSSGDAMRQTAVLELKRAKVFRKADAR